MSTQDTHDGANFGYERYVHICHAAVSDVSSRILEHRILELFP